MQSSKTSENNSISEYKTSLKDQSKSLNSEILFLTQEVREKNEPTKYKYIASTADDTKFHNINKDNNGKQNKYENISHKNINQNLDNNPIIIMIIILVFLMLIVILMLSHATNNSNSNHNTLNPNFNYDNQNKYKHNKSNNNNANNLNRNNDNNCNSNDNDIY